MSVPLLDLRIQNQALETELVEAFRRVLRGGQYILGPDLEDFERQAAQILCVPHALGISSGTDAILLALMALDIGPGDEVLVPSFTFFATAGCVARLGATPVFADVCPACFGLDAAEIDRRWSSKIRAVMPVHLFGQSADLSSIAEACARHGVPMIEDAAQAFGAHLRGVPVGGIGTFGTFSFFPSKNLGTLGDAGLLTTRDDALADRARLLRVHGARPKYYHELVGANFRMDALHAALLAVKLRHLPAYEERRRANAAFYSKALQTLPGVRPGVPGTCGCGLSGGAVPAGGERLVLPAAAEGRRHVWNQFTVRVPGPGRRDALRQFLADRGIGSEIYYPVPLHRQACFAPFRRAELPVSDLLAGEVLSLPIFPELTPDQRVSVVSAIAEFLGIKDWAGSAEGKALSQG